MLRPTREVERRLLRRHTLVAGIDEVGRGALAGPVSVGVAVVGRATRPRIPDGLADSKLLPAATREHLCAPIRAWVAGAAVGHASPAEIDAVGIVAALRLAAVRALIHVRASGLHPTAAILDGTHNWLVPDLLDDDAARAALAFDEVVMRVKADAHCAVVAAASVLAKVERDSHMIGLPDPGYGWDRNKGYGASAHLEALARLGPCDQHRRSWNLPCGEMSAPGGMIVG